MLNFPLQVKALRVEQPIGVYYVAILQARVLLEVAFSDVLSATLRDGEDHYELDGTQRLMNPKRLQMVADYINRPDSAFPNTIILAANFRSEDGLIEDEDCEDEDSENDGGSPPIVSRRWTVEEGDDGYCILTIPTKSKLAAIIDGQHRLFAFADARPQRLDMNLICSVFLDLPKPYQAQLFATINSTQKPVDKSLTYELFGYNVDEEDEGYWSPDKLAVFLTRKLGTEQKSPLKGRIVIAPQKDETLAKLTSDSSWKVSTSVVVEGIMRLFTTNPKKDTANLLDTERRKRTALEGLRRDRSPLRSAYLSNQDTVIYTMTLNYLVACDKIFWSKAVPSSFITKTVGVQALFDILRSLAKQSYDERDISVEYFAHYLSPAGSIDFSIDLFRNASGSGRSLIRRAIEAKLVNLDSHTPE
ncbi:DNA phosphorothioation-associated DGQHR protein 1 [Paraburkholderia caballeronis]|uniref:DNA phosphorothioation-associated DGQHR protein 1 n=1 Tax=Paraburkholderia caballeronis TaxID=416943 RepID=UPI001065E8CA|nr:DNA phosphorothioation-associated DGQHR protein 1 [Paraburkholderia caballeronis]TDV37459.1 DNA phosphorothioation-associated DGQHR protein 1 [Paraburkholderia caballeronis]